MAQNSSLGLSAALRAGTRPHHTAAERAGLMPALLRGQLSRARYAVLLSNLQAIYAALEAALDLHAGHPCIEPLWQPAMRRGAALQSDLMSFTGLQDLPVRLADATRAYVARIERLGRESPRLLVAHAYVRYLGDLSGGQVLARIVGDAYGPGAGVRFYDFGGAAQAQALAMSLRAALDTLPGDEQDLRLIVAEAVDAFARHQALFTELLEPLPA